MSCPYLLDQANRGGEVKISTGPNGVQPSPRHMRAIRVHEFGDPEVMRLYDDIPVPEITETQILIRVLAVGVNPVDTYVREGKRATLPSLPYTPGCDVAGVVEKVGTALMCSRSEDQSDLEDRLSKIRLDEASSRDSVDLVPPVSRRFAVGDRVYTMRTVSGGYAGYAAVEALHAFPLHSNLSFSQGAALGIAYFTAFDALVTQAQARRGDRLLVHGASGGVGLAACQIAAANGLEVYGTAGTDSGAEVVRRAGAKQVYNHRQSDYTERLARDTDGGVDIILEMLANVNLQRDMSLCRHDARIIVIGSRGRIEIDPRCMMVKNLRVSGMALGNVSEAQLQRIGAALHAGAEAGWVSPVIGTEYPLGEAAAAHREQIEHRDGSRGKIILSLN